MNILVTGGAGFIGGNFIRWMRNHAPEHRLINVDALTYAGNLESLSDILEDEHYHFIRADIRDRAKMGEIFRNYAITHVVQFCRGVARGSQHRRPGSVFKRRTSLATQCCSTPRKQS